MLRPENMVNPKQATGKIEIMVESLSVLNRAADKLPFSIREFQKAKEGLRMRYRYLDLRFPEMQRNMRARSQMLAAMREFLVHECNFVDVETPTLFKATPGVSTWMSGGLRTVQSAFGCRRLIVVLCRERKSLLCRRGFRASSTLWCKVRSNSNRC